MEPTQRLIVFVMSGIALLGVGWVFLFAYLTKKPADIATNIAPSTEQEEVITDQEEIPPKKFLSFQNHQHQLNNHKKITILNH